MQVLRRFDPWRSSLCTCPPKYSLQPYTGCSHACLYCYATSYVGLRRSRVKAGLLSRLSSDLRHADPALPVAVSTSSDPYPPEERELGVTRKVLELLLSRGFSVIVVTKSDLVVRDADVLRGKPAMVSITVTTLDEPLARRLEPGAPPPTRRLEVLAELSKAGIPVSARVDPVIPGLNDDPHELRELVARLAEAGVKHIVTSTYKAKPDNFARMVRAFPDMAYKWRRLYYEEGSRVGSYRYLPRALRAAMLRPVVEEARRLGLTYATCREGLTGRDYFNAPTCDGTHLIPRPARGG